MVKDKLYQEVYRPQFHFTAKKNWINDPNGLVYYKGEYHLFFQHKTSGNEWGNKEWGHAVSSDMVHWKQLANAIEPDELGAIYSGSGVVDWDNTAGFQSGKEEAMVNIYTSAGKPFTQSIAYSNDRGANFYAAQTWSDIPKSDGRRLQIAWMAGGKYPDMPFNQQMSFPCELTLRTTPEGIQLYRRPIKEIKNIHQKEYSWNNQILKPGENLLSDIHGELFHIQTEIEVGNAAEFGFIVRGESIRYTPANNELFCLGKSASLSTLQGKIKLEILVDRTSLEIFGNDGRISMSFCFLPDPRNTNLKIYSSRGKVRIVSLKVYEINSIWSAVNPIS